MQKVFLLLVALLEIVLFSGILFGWAAITDSVIKDSPDKGGTGMSSSEAQNAFVISSSLCLGSPFVLGFILDRFGPRVCNVLCISLVSIGLLLFGLSPASPKGVPGFTIGISLVGFGGPGIQGSLFSISNLFTKNKSLVTAMITAGFTVGFFVFFFFDIVHRIDPKTYTYKLLFTVHGCIGVFFSLLGLRIWPDRPYSIHHDYIRLDLAPDTALTDPTLSPQNSIEKGSVNLKGENKQAPIINDSLMELPLKKQVQTWEFMSTAFIFVVSIVFAQNFFVGTVNDQLSAAKFITKSGESHSDAKSYLLQFFNIASPLGVLFTPILGSVIDHFGFSLALLIVIIQGIIFSVGLLVSQVAVLKLALIVNGIFRTSVNTYFFAFIARVFGFKNFGILTGICFLIAGILSFIQFPLRSFGVGNWQEGTFGGDNWFSVNVIQLSFMISLVFVPLISWIRTFSQNESI